MEFQDKRSLFVCTLIISMYHMALIDGKYDDSEKRYINKVITQYRDFLEDIKKATKEFETAILKEEFVVNLLLQCKTEFTLEQNTSLIEHSIKVLAADGRIDAKEQFLIRSYLYTLGLPNTLFDKLIVNETIINK